MSVAAPIETKEQVDLLCKLSLGVPLAEAELLVREIEQTQAFLPFTDPTAYRAIARTLPNHLRIARAFLTFRKELDTVLASEWGAPETGGSQ